MQTLEEVHMPQNGINACGISALADAFAENRQLRIINLSDNTFTADGSVSMAAVSASVSSLGYLSSVSWLLDANVNWDYCWYASVL